MISLVRALMLRYPINAASDRRRKPHLVDQPVFLRKLRQPHVPGSRIDPAGPPDLHLVLGTEPQRPSLASRSNQHPDQWYEHRAGLCSVLPPRWLMSFDQLLHRPTQQRFAAERHAHCRSFPVSIWCFGPRLRSAIALGLPVSSLAIRATSCSATYRS